MEQSKGSRHLSRATCPFSSLQNMRVLGQSQSKMTLQRDLSSLELLNTLLKKIQCEVRPGEHSSGKTGYRPKLRSDACGWFSRCWAGESVLRVVQKV